MKTLIQGIKETAKGNLREARNVLEPLLERHSSDMVGVLSLVTLYKASQAICLCILQSAFANAV